MKLNGNKTYIVGVALIAYAVFGFVAGKIDINLAVAEVLVALQMMGLRHGIGKKE